MNIIMNHVRAVEEGGCVKTRSGVIDTPQQQPQSYCAAFFAVKHF